MMLLLGITMQWRPWVLAGVLWLLAGCLAPDGSVIRLQQAPNGSITGWQVDKPTRAAAPALTTERATSYPPRPILYWAFDPEKSEQLMMIVLSIYAVDQNGVSLGEVAAGWRPRWSPQGDRFSYIVMEEGDARFVVYLMVAALGEDGKPIFESDLKDLFPDMLPMWTAHPGFWLPSDWSPDGSQMAIGWLDERGSKVLLVEVENGQVINEFPLSDPDPTMLMPPVLVKWSPDGQKLLLRGLGTFVLDPQSGKVESIFEGPGNGHGELSSYSLPQWSPDSKGVIYFRYGSDQPGLWLKPMSEGAEQLLTAEQLAALGLEEVDKWLSFELSPSGAYLALTDSAHGRHETATLLVLDLRTLSSESPASWVSRQPVARWELPGVITPVKWSPDERALAFMMASDEGITVEVQAISATLSQTIARLPDEINAQEALAYWVNNGLDRVSWMR